MEESSIGASDIRSRLDQLSQSWDELKNMAANRLDGMLCVCVCMCMGILVFVCVVCGWGGRDFSLSVSCETAMKSHF